MTTIFKAILAGLVIVYLYKMFSGRKRSVKDPAKKRINTEGLPVKDAEFSEIKDKDEK